MKIEILESPYGDTGKTYEGMLGMIQHFRLQLISFRGQPGKTAHEEAWLEADIMGYEEILKSNSEENARAFMKIKRGPEWEENGFKDLFEDNLQIVEHLKTTGQWIEAPSSPDTKT